jgi:hypothetical protein
MKLSPPPKELVEEEEVEGEGELREVLLVDEVVGEREYEQVVVDPLEGYGEELLLEDSSVFELDLDPVGMRTGSGLMINSRIVMLEEFGKLGSELWVEAEEDLDLRR